IVRKRPRCGLLVAGQTGNRDVVEILHSWPAGAHARLRGQRAVVRGDRTAPAVFTTHFESVYAFGPSERVAVRVLDTVCAAIRTLARGPVHDIAFEEIRSHLKRYAVVFRQELECLFTLLAGFYFLFFRSKT